MATLGEKIREMRIQRGLTQSDLGADQVTASMISQIEADRANPSYSVLTHVANRLSMPVEYFMSDMEPKFSSATSVGIATYYILTQQPTEALSILDRYHDNDSYGLYHVAHMLLRAKAHRQLHAHEKAIYILEELREHAYRSQDKRLLFQVSKETGHIEYELANHLGAIHEWEKAASLAESLINSSELTQNELALDYIDVLFSLHTVISTTENNSTTDYLLRAQTISASYLHYRKIGQSYIQDAQYYMDSDPGRAKWFSERANAITEAARLIDQHILIDSQFLGASHGSTDIWSEAAMATISVSPLSFLETECTEIDLLLAQKNTEQVFRRITRSLDILLDYPADNAAYEQLRSSIFTRLYTARANAYETLGDLPSAISCLDVLVTELQSRPANITFLEKTLAQMLIWHGELGNHDQVMKLAEQIETMHRM